MSDETRTRMGFRASGERGAYLLVVRDESSFVFHLPRTGSVTIGRAADAELQVEHKSVSRRHATLTLTDGAATIADLGSHNGTRVNGELIAAPRAVASGDVAMIGDVVCVVHLGEVAAPAGHILYAEAPWRRRFQEELVRSVIAAAEPRPFAVLWIRAPADPTPITGRLDVIDVIGTTTGGDVLVLSPERTRNGARELAARIHATAPGAAIGFAMCPEDARDVDGILLAARAAAQRATSGTAVDAADAVTRLAIGEAEVVIADPAMLKLYGLIERLAPSPLPVLILGESGVGKEHAARAVHHYSKRPGPFVAVNCAALTPTLVESELFGHDKGAFTGAVSAKAGLFEAAHGGTLFLDEIGELPPAVQAKLLRVLESRVVVRVGETTERPVDVRIVAATLRDLDAEIAAGRFRQDLFFRLAGTTVLVPPLRDRRTELPALARDLLRAACAQAGRPTPVITPLAMWRLFEHAWPGNVRELRNTMTYVAATAPDERVEIEDLPEAIGGAKSPAPAIATALGPVTPPASFRPIGEELRELEQRRMMEALAAAGGVKTRAAALIDMPIRTFNFKLRQYKL